MRALVIVLLFHVTGCPPSKTPTKPMTDCSAALSAFGSVDPVNLRGLPATCTLAEMGTVLKPLSGSSRGLLGRDETAFDIRYFAGSSLPQITAWLDTSGRVLLLDAESPPGKLENFIAALGEPEARLDYVWGDSTLKGGELVWPAKGVVLVASGTNHLVRLAVFAPTTLADYETRLRYNGQYLTEDVDE